MYKRGVHKGETSAGIMQNVPDFDNMYSSPRPNQLPGETIVSPTFQAGQVQQENAGKTRRPQQLTGKLEDPEYEPLSAHAKTKFHGRTRSPGIRTADGTKTPPTPTGAAGRPQISFMEKHGERLQRALQAEKDARHAGDRDELPIYASIKELDSNKSQPQLSVNNADLETKVTLLTSENVKLRYLLQQMQNAVTSETRKTANAVTPGGETSSEKMKVEALMKENEQLRREKDEIRGKTERESADKIKELQDTIDVLVNDALKLGQGNAGGSLSNQLSVNSAGNDRRDSTAASGERRLSSREDDLQQKILILIQHLEKSNQEIERLNSVILKLEEHKASNAGIGSGEGVGDAGKLQSEVLRLKEENAALNRVNVELAQRERKETPRNVGNTEEMEGLKGKVAELMQEVARERANAVEFERQKTKMTGELEAMRQGEEVKLQESAKKIAQLERELGTVRAGSDAREKEIQGKVGILMEEMSKLKQVEVNAMENRTKLQFATTENARLNGLLQQNELSQAVLQGELAKLRAETEKFQQETETHAAQVGQVTALQVELEQLRGVKQRMEEEHRNETGMMSGEINRLKAMAQQFKTDLDRAKASATDNTRITGELTRANMRIKQLEEELQKEREKDQELEARERGLIEDLRRMRLKEGRIQELESKIDVLNADAAKAKAGYDGKIRENEIKLAELVNELARSKLNGEARTKELEGNCGRLQEEIGKQAREREETVKVYERKLAILQEEINRLAQKMQSGASLESECGLLQGKLLNYEEKIARLQEELGKCRTADANVVKEVTSLREQAATEQKRRKEQEMIVQNLTGEMIKAANQSEAKTREYLAEIANLQGQLDAMKAVEKPGAAIISQRPQAPQPQVAAAPVPGQIVIPTVPMKSPDASSASKSAKETGKKSPDYAVGCIFLGLEVERLQALKMNMIEYMETLEKQIEVLQVDLQKAKETAAAEQQKAPVASVQGVQSDRMQGVLDDLEDKEIGVFLLGVENERLHMIMGELEDVRIAKVHNEIQLKEQVQRLQELLQEHEKNRGFYTSPTQPGQYQPQSGALGSPSGYSGGNNGGAGGNRYNFISS